MASERTIGSETVIDDVEVALRDIVGSAPTLRHARGSGRIFELYVMTGIARALRNRGYDVWIQRSDGSRVQPNDAQWEFVQRGGVPAGIPPATAGPGEATTVVFWRRYGPKWEMLNGVTFEGRSHALHEIDIAIVPRAVAVALRSRQGGSPTGRPLVSIECKDMGTNGSVDEMRAFVARLYDITLLHSHHRYLRLPGPARAIHPGAPPHRMNFPAATYWEENHRTFNVLARRTAFVNGAVMLSGYHAVAPYGGIVVGSASADELMDDVAEWNQCARLLTCAASDVSAGTRPLADTHPERGLW